MLGNLLSLKVSFAPSHNLGSLLLAASKSFKWPSFSLRKVSVMSVGAALLLASQLTLACPGKQCKDGQCPYKQEKWSSTLGLEGEKASKLDELQTQFKEEKHALKQEQKEKMRNLKADHKAALESVLSPEEVQKLENSWHSKHDKHDDHHKKEFWKDDKEGKQCPHKKQTEA